MRFAPASTFTGSDGGKTRRNNTTAESSSIALSPPKASSAGLRAVQAAPNETPASTLIQMSVRHEAVVSQRSRRLQHLLPVAGEVETSHAQHQIQCRRAGEVTMARWPRLYHNRGALLFGRGLYWLT